MDDIDTGLSQKTLQKRVAVGLLMVMLDGARGFQSKASQFPDEQIRGDLEAYYDRIIEDIFGLAEQHQLKLSERAQRAAGNTLPETER